MAQVSTIGPRPVASRARSSHSHAVSSNTSVPWVMTTPDAPPSRARRASAATDAASSVVRFQLPGTDRSTRSTGPVGPPARASRSAADSVVVTGPSGDRVEAIVPPVAMSVTDMVTDRRPGNLPTGADHQGGTWHGSTCPTATTTN